MKFTLTIETDDASALEMFCVLADLLCDPREKAIDFSQPALPVALLALMGNLHKSARLFGMKQLAEDTMNLWIHLFQEHHSLQRLIRQTQEPGV